MAQAATATRNGKQVSSFYSQQIVGEISKRAYEIHLKRGAQHGHDMDDWLKAEREIKAKYRIA